MLASEIFSVSSTQNGDLRIRTFIPLTMGRGVYKTWARPWPGPWPTLWPTLWPTPWWHPKFCNFTSYKKTNNYLRVQGSSAENLRIAATFFYQTRPQGVLGLRLSKALGQYESRTADYGLGIRHGLSIKRGLSITDWV